MPDDPYIIEDSGTRQEFETGAHRDITEGKGRYDLISLILMERLAKHSEGGVKKYGEHNWRKGIPLTSYLSSATHHLSCLCEGMITEDHAAAVVWNMQGFMWTHDQIDKGKLPRNLANGCLIARHLWEIADEEASQTKDGSCHGY